nr:MAG TPA: hypothetical protein [Caudoviricetes sp.]
MSLHSTFPLIVTYKFRLSLYPRYAFKAIRI